MHSGIMFERCRDNDRRSDVSKPPRIATVIPVNSTTRGERRAPHALFVRGDRDRSAARVALIIG
jgi:hypothetical protein